MIETPITQVLLELQSGNRGAMDELLPLVYDELRRLAGHYLRQEREGHTLQPTALVHEAYLRLVGQKEIDWQSRAHFFGVSSRLMREILIEHARGKKRLKRGGPFATQVELDAAISFDPKGTLDVLAVNEALIRLEELDKRQARIVEMKFFAGMSIEQISTVLDISPATIKREWTSAKLFLARQLGNDK